MPSGHFAGELLGPRFGRSLPRRVGLGGRSRGDAKLGTAKLPAPNAWVHPAALIPLAFRSRRASVCCFGDSPQCNSSNHCRSHIGPAAPESPETGFRVAYAFFLNHLLLTLSFFSSAQLFHPRRLPECRGGAACVHLPRSKMANDIAVRSEKIPRPGDARTNPRAAGGQAQP